MTIKSCVPNAARLAFLKGEVRPDHVFKIALYTDKASLGPETKVYTPVGEVAVAGYAPKALSSPLFGTDSEDGGATMGFDGEVVWPNVTIAAAGCMIYDETLDNLAVFVGDFGAIIASTNDKFKLNMVTDLIKFVG
jgi:hypothetical protein